jgi:hypothetical protein
MNTSIVTLQYNDFPVMFQSNAFINATAIAKQFGKKTEGYLRTNETKEYIAALEKWLFPTENSNVLKSALEQNQDVSVARKSVTEQNQLVRVVQGGNNQGTWLHPKLAVHFARWLNADFAVWCDMQIDKLLKTVPNALRELPRPNITGMEAAQLKRSIEAAAKKNAKMYSELYRKLHCAYGIDSYLNLPAGKLNEALVFLGLKPAEMPKTVMISVEEYNALKMSKPEPKQGVLVDMPTLMLALPNDNNRIVVIRHNGVTSMFEMPENYLFGSPETLARDLKALGYIVVKKDEVVSRLAA